VASVMWSTADACAGLSDALSQRALYPVMRAGVGPPYAVFTQLFF
jgi:hypothetical protein